MASSHPLIHVVGARPNFMKAAPVVAALADRGAHQMLVHTGQHYDAALSAVFFDELGLPEPDLHLGVGSGSHGHQTAALLTGLEDAFVTHRPGMVVVYGDVNSTLAAALVAAKLQIPIAHVEAGLRSFDRTMPEEINRIVTDTLATLHLITSPEARDHLLREGIDPAGIHHVGNPMIDTLLRFRDAVDADGVLGRVGLTGPFGLVTLHRPSNVDDPEVAARLVAALGRVSQEVELLFPVHPRGRAALEAAGLGSHPGIRTVEPLPYTDFLALMSRAAVVLTDSGGIQEETTVLGTPCLTLRDNTERPITVTDGTNRLVGTDPDTIVAAAREALSSDDRVPRHPPLWDGRAGERIAAILAG